MKTKQTTKIILICGLFIVLGLLIGLGAHYSYKIALNETKKVLAETNKNKVSLAETSKIKLPLERLISTQPLIEDDTLFVNNQQIEWVLLPKGTKILKSEPELVRIINQVYKNEYFGKISFLGSRPLLCHSPELVEDYFQKENKWDLWVTINKKYRSYPSLYSPISAIVMVSIFQLSFWNEDIKM